MNDDTTPYETLLLRTDDDGIATLTLNRPDALNAFDLTMARELADFFTTRAYDEEIRAVVVTGAGRAFCAGMDLAADGSSPDNPFGLDESLSPTPESLRAHIADPAVHPEYDAGLRDTGGRVSLAIHALPKPVIAAINGPAVGVGATMTCAMDARLASEKARIGFVFGRIGVVPEACSSYFLPRIVGLAQALEWVYTADILTADEALAGRLVRSVHAPDELLPAAYELARRFVVGHSAAAVGLAKQLLTHDATGPLDAHLAESLAMWHVSTRDGREGVAAFREKRKPVFTSTTADLPRVF